MIRFLSITAHLGWVGHDFQLETNRTWTESAGFLP